MNLTNSAAMIRPIFSRRASLTLQTPQGSPLPLLFRSTTTPLATSAADGISKYPTRSPPPIRVTLTESAGRGTFATRKIAAGELIHTAEPLVAHPFLNLLHKVCYFCLKRLGSSGIGSTRFGLTQNGNQIIHFCSKDCRENSKVFYEVEKRADWSAYDGHCRQRQLKYPLLVKRLACMVVSGALSVDGLDILQPTTLFPEMILEMEEEFRLLMSTFIEAGFDNEQLAFLTKQWYIGVLARIRINAFRIELIGGSYEDLLSSAAASVETELAVGNAIYMLPSFYNHDCDPCAHIVWIENANARMKALRDIEEGEELRICYIDASMGHDARQILLFEGFGFRCNCLRCMSGD